VKIEIDLFQTGKLSKESTFYAKYLAEHLVFCGGHTKKNFFIYAGVTHSILAGSL